MFQPSVERLHQRKPCHSAVVRGHFLRKHRQRAHPHAVVAIKRSIHGQGLFRFAVPRGVQQFVELAFVVAVEATGQGVGLGGFLVKCSPDYSLNRWAAWALWF